MWTRVYRDAIVNMVQTICQTSTQTVTTVTLHFQLTGLFIECYVRLREKSQSVSQKGSLGIAEAATVIKRRLETRKHWCS